MKQRFRHVFSIIAATLLAIAGLTGCIATPDSAGGDAGAIRIGTLRGQPHLYAPYFMQRFAPENTTYEIVLFENSPDIKNALASGAIDIGVLGAPAMLSGVAAEQDVQIIASAADGGSGFVGSPKIRTPEELRGKRIGFPAGSSQEIALKLTLRAHGLDPDTDVQLVNLAYSDMASAYTSGRVDAFLSAEMGVSIARQAGAHQIVSPYDTSIGATNIVLGGNGRFLDEHPDRARDTVQTFARAIDFMKADRETWAAGLVETFAMDRAVTDIAIDNVRLRWELDDEYRQRVTELARQMVDFDQLPAAPDMSKVFRTEFLDTVNAQR
ncbi:ABC transporter substrate-binding protein [Nocardia sp. NBC_01329]|uniref:ABC transporter substrate-binding protein n=1 Tax=Nocardia sp. NBC_01329 TaxID=2903594 RepID=UPI002E142363|nr:ABC transporter substrate-binding protein [Nocardia sp. NBC_01329]